MKKIILIAAMAALLSACGGSSTEQTPEGSITPGTGLNNAKSVTGTLYSSSGDPIPGATVYLPGVIVTKSLDSPTRSFSKTVTGADGTTCEDPLSADGSLVATCTAQDGTFSLNTSAIATNPGQIIFAKGSLRMLSPLSCGSETCTLSSSFTTYGALGSTTTWPKIAVVTGYYDRMEDVLAKIADTNTADEINGQYGRVDSSSGEFIYGSEYGTNMTIIDGGSYLAPYENIDLVSYRTWEDYLNGTYPLLDGSGKPLFDIIFINCGNSNDSMLNSVAIRKVLQDYVAAGGRLYVTDLSYDFVEQAFPQVMMFENDPIDPLTPGSNGDAENGEGGIHLNATVKNTGMQSWLSNVTVNSYNGTAPGNPDDCTYDVTYSQVTGALVGGLIPIGDFLPMWTHMTGAHAGYTPTVWISSGSVNFDGQLDRPLTISMDMSAGGGRIVYSSYHTADQCASLGFWPQERVLQYLIFESF